MDTDIWQYIDIYQQSINSNLLSGIQRHGTIQIIINQLSTLEYFIVMDKKT